MSISADMTGAVFGPAQNSAALVSSFSQPLFDALALSAHAVSQGRQGTDAGEASHSQSRGYLVTVQLRPRLLWTVRTLRAGRAAITGGNLAVVRDAVDLVRREVEDGPYDHISRLVVGREMDEVQRWCTMMSAYAPDGPRDMALEDFIEALSFDMFRFAGLLRLVGLPELAQGYDDGAMKLRSEPAPDGVERAREFAASTFRYSGWGSIIDRYVCRPDGSVDEVLNDDYEELSRKLSDFGRGGLWPDGPGPAAAQ